MIMSGSTDPHDTLLNDLKVLKVPKVVKVVKVFSPLCIAFQFLRIDIFYFQQYARILYTS